VLNGVWPVPSFPERLNAWTLERFQPITAAATCTVSINVLEPGALNSESQYFIPLFNKISWLCRQQQRGDEASNGGGCNSGPIGHDFNIYRITLLFTFYFLPMRTGPFSKCENRSGSHIGCQVRTWAVLTSSENHQSWISWRFSSWILIENRTENRRQLSTDEWEPPSPGEDQCFFIKNIIFWWQ
jgi:hypothetical protein